MSTISDEKTHELFFQIVKEINRLWQDGPFEKLKDYFHEKMVIVSPDLQVLGDGREACIKSYAEFVSQARIDKYEENPPEVHAWGNTAVVSYTLKSFCGVQGPAARETYRELLQKEPLAARGKECNLKNLVF